MSLDDDLAAWAAAVRLPEADAAAIFQRIVASPVVAPVAPTAATTPPARPAVVGRAAVADVAGPARAPKLKASWWRGYNAGFAARMVASTTPARLAA